MIKWLWILIGGCYCLWLPGCVTENNPTAISDSKKIKAALINVELGKAYLQQGNHARAKAKLAHALVLAPKLAAANNAMANYWESVGEIKEAGLYYKKAVRFGNKAAEFHGQYAMFLCNHDRYAAAREQFELAFKDKMYPQIAIIYANAGWCALRHKQLNDAKLYLNKAFRHDPSEMNYLLQLTNIAIQEGNLADANNYLDAFTNSKGHTAYSLLLGIKLANSQNLPDIAASKELLLKNLFPTSSEYRAYLENKELDLKD